MLQYKDYLDLAFYLGCRGKEVLHSLTLDSFELSFTAEGRRYIRMTHQEVSKWHQGEKPTNDHNLFKEECNNVIAEQPGNPRCPVQSFELWIK